MVLWAVALPGYLLGLVAVAAHGVGALEREVFWLGVLLVTPVYLEKLYRRTATSVGAARDRIGASRKLSSATTYRFFADCMETQRPAAAAVTPWADVGSVVELDVGFIFCEKSGAAAYLPRRCFRSELERDALRVILRGALGRRFRVCLERA